MWFKPRITLLLSIAILMPHGLRAQQGDYSRLYSRAEAEHNAAYSQACLKLTPPVQELLIRAELSWTKFSDKEKSLMKALRMENLVFDEFVHSHSIDVVAARTSHVKAFFVDYNFDYPPQYTPENLDQELNKTYADCVHRLSVADQKLLLSSERAWITYRDADIAVAVAGSDDPRWKNAALVHLTTVRTSELASIVQALREPPASKPTIQEIPPSPLQSNYQAPDDVKALVEFQEGAKASFKALLEKKDDPFFKKGNALKIAPELPSEVSKQIPHLEAEYAALLNKHYADKFLEPASNEGALVEALASWSEFTQNLKAGEAAKAELAIQKAVSEKPKVIVTDYLPFWQTIGDWHDVFVIEEAKYDAHISKGNSLTGLGKSTAAIKEYQEAYDIIHNPRVSEKIKQLNEQSLGL